MIQTLTFALALTAACAASAAAVFAAKHAIVPQPVRYERVTPCKGMHGFERCLRQIVESQGGGDASLTCGIAKRGVVPEYSCLMDVGLGGGCYDLAAHRANPDGFPILDSAAQRSTC